MSARARAARLDSGDVSRTTDTHGAEEEVARHPFDSVLLALLGMAVVGFAVHQVIQDSDRAPDCDKLAKLDLPAFWADPAIWRNAECRYKSGSLPS